MGSSIKTIELSKKFGETHAVQSVSFDVEEREIFGFLGRNGAGKTTTIMMLITLLKPSAGQAFVAGHDIVREADKVRQSVGYVSQEIAVDEYLTGRENLLLQGHLYHIPTSDLKKRMDEVLEMVDLQERAKDQVSTYSGGMRKRLDIAGGLLHRPKVLFLDEPTLGLDIQTRSKIWGFIKRLRDEHGITIFLTTHYMEEADLLCDRIAIIDRGSLKVIGKPSELKSNLGEELVTISFNVEPKPQQLEALTSIPNVKEIKSDNAGTFNLSTVSGETTIPRIFEISSKMGLTIQSVSLKKTSLDDVFLSYTGRALREEYSSEWEGRADFEKWRRIRH